MNKFDCKVNWITSLTPRDPLISCLHRRCCRTGTFPLVKRVFALFPFRVCELICLPTNERERVLSQKQVEFVLSSGRVKCLSVIVNIIIPCKICSDNVAKRYKGIHVSVSQSLEKSLNFAVFECLPFSPEGIFCLQSSTSRTKRRTLIGGSRDPSIDWLSVSFNGPWDRNGREEEVTSGKNKFR